MAERIDIMSEIRAFELASTAFDERFEKTRLDEDFSFPWLLRDSDDDSSMTAYEDDDEPAAVKSTTPTPTSPVLVDDDPEVVFIAPFCRDHVALCLSGCLPLDETRITSKRMFRACVDVEHLRTILREEATTNPLATEIARELERLDASLREVSQLASPVSVERFLDERLRACELIARAHRVGDWTVLEPAVAYGAFASLCATVDDWVRCGASNASPQVVALCEAHLGTRTASALRLLSELDARSPSNETEDAGRRASPSTAALFISPDPSGLRLRSTLCRVAVIVENAVVRAERVAYTRQAEDAREAVDVLKRFVLLRDDAWTSVLLERDPDSAYSSTERAAGDLDRFERLTTPKLAKRAKDVHDKLVALRSARLDALSVRRDLLCTSRETTRIDRVRAQRVLAHVQFSMAYDMVFESACGVDVSDDGCETRRDFLRRLERALEEIDSVISLGLDESHELVARALVKASKLSRSFCRAFRASEHLAHAHESFLSCVGFLVNSASGADALAILDFNGYFARAHIVSKRRTTHRLEV